MAWQVRTDTSIGTAMLFLFGAFYLWHCFVPRKMCGRADTARMIAVDDAFVYSLTTVAVNMVIFNECARAHLLARRAQIGARRRGSAMHNASTTFAIKLFFYHYFVYMIMSSDFFALRAWCAESTRRRCIHQNRMMRARNATDENVEKSILK